VFEHVCDISHLSLTHTHTHTETRDEDCITRNTLTPHTHTRTQKLGMQIEHDVLVVMMQVIDTDGSGTVDEEEFYAFVVKFVTGEILDMSQNIVRGEKPDALG